GGLTTLESRLRLEQRGADVIKDLAIHALHVDELTRRIDDVDRRRAALRGRPVAARARNLLGRRERNLIAVKYVGSRLARDDEFGRERRFRLSGCAKARNRVAAGVGV